MGLEREADGTVSAIVQMCKGGVDTVVVYAVQGGATSSDDEVGRWDFLERVTDRGAVPLGAEFERSLYATSTYRAFAGSSDNSWSADGPEFTSVDIDDLPVGSIWAIGGVDDHTPRAHTADEFDAMAQSYCTQI